MLEEDYQECGILTLQEVDQIPSPKENTIQQKNRSTYYKREMEIAEKYGVSQTEVALAWLLSKMQVDSVIIGATKQKHLDEATASLNLKLTQADISYLEELYVAHKVVGASYK